MADDRSTPEWLNADFLSKCLGEEVAAVDGRPAAPPGNNYGSVVTRVRATMGDGRTMRLIVKSEVTVGKLGEFIKDIKDVEFDFYYEVIPVLAKIASTDFYPRSFFSSRPKTILLEDLTERGFVMVERSKQLDFEHCRLYATAAAAFHAGTFAVHRRRPALIRAAGEEQFYVEGDNANSHMLKAVLGNSLRQFVESTAAVDGYQHVREMIDVDAEAYWKMSVKAIRPGEDGLNALTQGDPWLTNMMFRYDDGGAVEEIKLIDFQALRYTTPVADLMFFVWTSANDDVRNGRLDELFRLYLDAFNARLRELGCEESFSFDCLRDHIRRLSPFILFIASGFLPCVTDAEPMDMDGLLAQDGEKGNYFKRYYTDRYCREKLPQILAQLESLDVFKSFQCEFKKL